MARGRKARRAAERSDKKLALARLKLAAFEVGFSPAKPVVVESPSQIEPHIRAMACPACAVALQFVDDVAKPGVRLVHARCSQCARTFDIHFRLQSSLLS